VVEIDADSSSSGKAGLLRRMRVRTMMRALPFTVFLSP